MHTEVPRDYSFLAEPYRSRKITPYQVCCGILRPDHQREVIYDRVLGGTSCPTIEVRCLM